MFKTLAFLLAVGSLCGHALSSITGAGSSFVAPVMYKWSYDYYQQNSTEINYQSIGSGAGIKQIESKTIHFGTSDLPLTDEQLAKKGLIQFPIIVGGVLMVTHIDGIQPGQLVLDAKTIAQIYNGQIQKWNDPQILALNPQLHLPAQNITVVYRSDGSGTTYNFSNFLQKSVPHVWKNGVGSSLSWSPLIKGTGGKGNEGVPAIVKQSSGSIGYVEYSYAMGSSKLSWVRMKNLAGFVVPQLDASDFSSPQKVNAAFKSSFASVLVNLDWNKNKGMSVDLSNSPNATAWPMTSCSYVLIQKVQNNAELAKQMFDFFHYAYTTGIKDADSLNYISLPSTAVQMIDKKWKNEVTYATQ